MKSMLPFTFLLLGTLANAETLFPMPSVPDVTAAYGWAVALGAGFEYESEYDGSDDVEGVVRRIALDHAAF